MDYCKSLLLSIIQIVVFVYRKSLKQNLDLANDMDMVVHHKFCQLRTGTLKQDIVFHNFWDNDSSVNLSSTSKYILIVVLSLACKSIISSTSDGTKQSFDVQWFVVKAVNNIKHQSL